MDRTVRKQLSNFDITLKAEIDINVLNIQRKPSNFMEVQHIVTQFFSERSHKSGGRSI